jgi:hypothetical protein
MCKAQAFHPETDGIGIILLDNPDSHFYLQKPINIIGDAKLKMQNLFYL